MGQVEKVVVDANLVGERSASLAGQGSETQAPILGEVYGIDHEYQSIRSLPGCRRCASLAMGVGPSLPDL